MLSTLDILLGGLKVWAPTHSRPGAKWLLHSPSRQETESGPPAP